MENKIRNTLIALGICDEGSVKIFHPNVRDREGIQVLKCNRSGVIFLSRSDHLEGEYYENKKGFQYWNAEDADRAKLFGIEDDLRRFDQFKAVVMSKKWLDIGTGSGGLLDLLDSFTNETIAVEPQAAARQYLKESGYDVHADIVDVPNEHCEIATLFHVFEHIQDPLEFLKVLYTKLTKDAKVIIEVPHAKDFLISSLDLEEFKSFTFWSEHLILHTRDSLKLMLEKAGFSEITITGFQRYPLANHLYWLAKRKPGGHLKWPHLRSVDLENAYSDLLARIDQTDTLIAFATKL